MSDQPATPLAPSPFVAPDRGAVIAAVRAQFFEDLLPVPDFALVIGRCEKTVRNLIGRGLPHTRMGGACYVRVTPARAWMIAQGTPRREPRGRGRPAKDSRA